MKDYKVLHVDTGKEWRGGQRQVYILHKLLIENDINSFLLCNKEGELYKVCMDKKIKNVYPAEYKNELKSSEYTEIIHNISPEILHAHDGHAVAVCAKNKGGRLFFNTRRVSYPISFLSRIFKYSKIDVHVGVGEAISEYLLRYFKNVHTIDSCIEMDRFKKSIANPLLVNDKKFQLLFVGAFSEQKGIHIVLQAAEKLSKKTEDFHLHLVGDGELLEKMKNLVKELKINELVTFYGSRKDIENFYHNSDIVIVPSVDGEGSNGVIKEGMACGKTVIASDLKENLSLGVDKQSLIFFKSTDIKELSDTILDIFDNKILLKKEAVTSNSERFDCKNTVRKYINLYNSYLNGN